MSGGEDRRDYRRDRPGGPDKRGEAGPGANTDFQFRGGFGRGRPAEPTQAEQE